LLERIDTMMLATANPSGGADVSHRGGHPGFVRYESGSLQWDEYDADSMFNTLGNLQLDGRAAHGAKGRSPASPVRSNCRGSTQRCDNAGQPAGGNCVG
jgi:hypothetical protein